MTGLSYKSAVFSIVIVCFLGGSAAADTFTFTGDAFLGESNTNSDLFEGSFIIQSSRFGGSGLILILPQVIPTIPDDSGGTVGGVEADTSMGDLTFSSSSFTAEPDVFSWPVTVTGELTGYVFPLGCEATDVSPQMFDLQISGSGTGTFSDSSITSYGIRGYEFTFSGSATTVPEPSNLLLLGSGLTGFVAIRRRHLLRRVKH